MKSKIICGDAEAALRELPAGIARTCVTSPPYFGLRDYGMNEQIGLEVSPEKYIQRLVGVFREVRRVLADDGTLWVNIADSYAGSGRGAWAEKDKQKEVYVTPPDGPQAKMARRWDGIKPKDLIGIPWMLAFALRADGWYLRQDIIWVKPNPMPESVKDRCSRCHEYIFLFSKSRQYFYNCQAIEEPIAESTRGRKAVEFGGKKGRNYTPEPGDPNYRNGSEQWGRGWEYNKETRNKRDVWQVATVPFRGEHFATFPPELIRPCILAGSEQGDFVIDPFLGSGTTGMVAAQEGRKSIGIELNPEFAEIARQRIKQNSTKQLTLGEVGLCGRADT